MKIAGDRPSQDILRHREANEVSLADGSHEQARRLGQCVAEIFSRDAADFHYDTSDHEMILQRRLLLSFTATVGFEKFCRDDADCGIAQKAFLDTLREKSPELYESSSDTGAFSFYYLAYRRGADVERRIGQTFAMLCSHDGDNVYQELGEALYCWFSSVVKDHAEKLNLC